MNNVEYKYPLGKKVFFLDRSKTNREFDCPTCLGTGNLLREDGSKLQCPHCYGKGKIVDYSEYIYSVNSGMIDEVSITIYSTDTAILYSINTDDKEGFSPCYNEEELFITEEEAKEKCNKMNKNLKFD